VFYEEFYEVGIHNITDLYDSESRLTTFKEWLAKGLPSQNWLKWYGLMNAIKHVSVATGQCCVQSAIFVMNNKNVIESTTKDVYMHITEKAGPSTLHIPRISKYVSFGDNFEWENVYMYPFKFLMDSNSKDFQYRCLHDIVINRYWLEKWKLIDTNLCRLCKNEIENISHMFWNCLLVQTFWNNLNIYLIAKLNISISMEDVFYGKNDLVVNTIIVNAKKCIYKAFMVDKAPRLDIFLHFLSNIIIIEQNMYKRNGKLNEWKKKWESFILNDNVFI
jgi:hypothetical protein